LREWANYTHLYFEGGGVKGYAYPYALRVLETEGVIKRSKVKVCAGSSAGSGAAFLYAAGLSPQETSKLIDINFSKFMDDSLGYIRDLLRLNSDWGFYKGEALTKWLKSLVKEALGDKNATFAKLEKTTGRKLYVTAFNVNTADLFWFSPVHTPDVPIWLGMRASMSIPGFFVPVKFGDYYLTDGGWMSNLPDLPGGNGELGFRLVGDRDCQAIKKIESFSDFISAHVDGHMKQQEKLHVSDNLWKNMVTIKTGTVSTTDFDLSTAQKKYLTLQGELGAYVFIEGKKVEYQESQGKVKS
jgi:hypothetical protein